MDIKFKKSESENKLPDESIGSSKYFEDAPASEEDMEQMQEKSNDKIKLETISKDEIYRNKLEKEKAFVAKFRKSEESEKESTAPSTEKIEEKSTSRKSTILIIIGALLVAGLITAAYFYFLRNSTVPEAEQVLVDTESPTDSQAQIANDEEAQPENNEEVPVVEEKETMPSEVSVKVLNEGAATGSAAKVKGILIGKGYSKTVAGNGEKENVVGTFVYYKEEKFKKLAEAINEILSINKIKSEILLAVSTEQKSADIVVILGK